MFKLENIQKRDCSKVLNFIGRVQANRSVLLYTMRITKFFSQSIIRNRQLVIMHPGAERIWDISY